MNIILSIIYAPIVLMSLRYFDIQTVSIYLLFFSCVWLLLTLKTPSKESLYPLLYVVFSLGAYFLDTFLVLKALPLSISIIITGIIAVSYINKQSLILYFAQRFSKHTIDEKEEEYIHHSTLFWILISCINIALHLTLLLSDNIDFWMYYSCCGWYLIFILGGIFQFLHRKLIFLKETHV
jgi:uncharacterized membrane protein